MKIFALAVLLLSSQAHGQTTAAKPPAALEKVRLAFAAAVAARAPPAMAKLSRFPLAVEVYGSGPQLGEREFLRKRDYFNGWFFDGDPETVKCLRQQTFAYQGNKKAFGSGNWYLDCNGNEYYFGASAGHWAFAGYQNINE